MDVLLPLFQLLYFIVHFLVSLLQASYETYQDLSLIIVRLFKFNIYNNLCKEKQEIHAHLLLLKKKPKHLAFLLRTDQVVFIKQLASAISWAVQYQIKFISVYDTRGVLRQKWRSLHDHLVNLQPDIEFIQGPYVEMKEEDSGRVVVINTLSLEHGKVDLTNISGALCGSNTEITDKSIQSLLCTKGQPNPDLVVAIGTPTATLGFLPWQIELSEFSSISSLKRFSYPRFKSLLNLYSHCEQRYGK